MLMTSFLLKIIKFFQVLLIPIFLLGGSVRLVTSERFLEIEYARSGFPPDLYGFSSSQRLILASKNLEIVREGLPLTSLSQQNIDGLPVYNPREMAHMQDVQDVFQAVWRAWQFSFAFLIIIGVLQWFITRNPFTFASSLQTGGFLTIGLVTGIGLVATFGWQLWFELFHRFFFQPGSWLFEYSDTLIRLFPVQFWFDITLTISVMNLIGAVLLAILGWRWKLAIQKP
jgi:integral membrane protein (TIGR01906 family)